MDAPTSALEICAECAEKLGVIPMPPPRRPARPCLRCNGTRFVRAIPREYTAHGADYVWERVAPMTLTATPLVKERIFFSGNEVQAPDIAEHGHGKLEVYACVGCGYVEWYCLDPERVPIGPEYMTELVDVTPPAPYR
jgi:hypothetical protein